MANSMLQPAHGSPLNSVRRATPAKAKLIVNEVHANEIAISAELFRQAVDDSGLTDKEAMDAMGVKHKSEFSEMKTGKRKVWLDQLLRKEARAIWCELIAITARRSGYAVERVIRWKEESA